MELEEQIRQLDLENATDPSIDKHNKIAVLTFKLNQILSASYRYFNILSKKTLNSVTNRTNFWHVS